jgi:hypothetical protein
MKAVQNIAELMQRGMKEDPKAQQAVVELSQRIQNDPEFEQIMRDAAARVKEGRVPGDKEQDSDRIYQQVQEEVGGSKKPTEREAKLLRLLFEARMKLKEMGVGPEGLRAGEAGAQDARVPQGERGAQASALPRGKEGAGQERGQPRTRPQTVPQGNRTLQGGQQNG